jgi:hypothetical protein
MVSLSKRHKLTVPIEGHAVAVRLARLTYDQAEALRRGLEALRLKTLRQRRELDGADTFAPEELARIQEVQDREDRETDAFVRAAIEAYVTVEPNQITVDGREVTSGEDLLTYFGADTSLVMRLIAGIEAGSRLSAEAGKTSGSPSDSTRSSGASDASGPEAPGTLPEEIAGSAVRAATTGIAAVTAETDRPSSGSTATLN